MNKHITQMHAQSKFGPVFISENMESCCWSMPLLNIT